MVKKILIRIQWLTQHKNLCIGIFALIIIMRFGFLNYYNWHHGNTGKAGVQYNIDSYRLLEGAEHFLDDGTLGYKQIDYSGYLIILAFVKLIGLRLETVVIIQLIMALVSSWFLFDLGKRITGSSLAGIIAAGLYLANPFICIWHLYILTESLYTSLLIISVWALARAVQKRTIKYYLLSIAVVCITASIRPNGWILFPIMFCAFLVFSKLKQYIKWSGVFIIIILFVLSISSLPILNKAVQNVALEEAPINKVLTNGEVVFGHEELRLEMPEDSSLTNKNWTESYMYIIRHPLACGKLAVYRITSELFQINRNWFSLAYQIRMWFWLLPAYLLAIFGFIYYKKQATMKIVLIIIMAHLLIIGLTYADHEHRFLNYFLPLIYLFSACGSVYLLNKCLTWIQSKQ